MKFPNDILPSIKTTYGRVPYEGVLPGEKPFVSKGNQKKRSSAEPDKIENNKLPGDAPTDQIEYDVSEE